MVEVKILKNNDCYKAGKSILPLGVMVHSTGANNPNVNRYVPIGDKYSANHWDKPGISKCVHAFIGYMPDGGVGIVQTLPFTMRGWHAGGAANNTHIGFECCEDDLKNEQYFHQIVDAAAEFTAYICKRFGLDPLQDGVVISHHEGHLRGVASNHADIDHWFKLYGYSMYDFRHYVHELMEDYGMDKERFKELESEVYLDKAKEGASQWSEKYDIIGKVKELGISDGSKPQCWATREEVFAMMVNLYNKMKEEK